MTDLFVHGVPQTTVDDGEGGGDHEYVTLTTPIAIGGRVVREFLESDEVDDVDPIIRVYRLVDLGPLVDLDAEDF